MIVRVKEGSSRDLEELCGRYWYPLYAYARRAGQSPENSEDLTQGFLAKLLEREWLKKADQDLGKLRTFLLTYFKGYMRDEWSKGQALKRGGDVSQVSIDLQDAENRYIHEPADETTPEALFDQAWASTLLSGVLEQLRNEFVQGGKEEQFNRLQQCLAWNSNSDSYASIATDLGISVAGVKSAVHRMRARYRTLLNEAISETLNDPDELDAEIDALFAVFG